MPDTIYALSSAPGKAGVSVIRVSGADAYTSYRALTRSSTLPAPRTMGLKHVFDPKNNEVIDYAMILTFKGPESFTGEDVIEYHIHGSPAIVDALYRILSQQPCHRLAQPGEFTRRSFENGKTDLTRAEAIADLINAQTEYQRRQAVLQMGGALSRLYDGWREELIRALAYVEAVIDFPDEDIPDSETSKAIPAIQNIVGAITAHLNDNRRGERLRDGITICLLGAPNAGKSTLMNLMAGRDVAIVSPMAGTTRDVLEVYLDLSGYPITLIDTAGIRDVSMHEKNSHEGIEKEGIRRALSRASEADITLLLFDGSQDDLDQKTLSLVSANSLCLVTKSDLGKSGDLKVKLQASGISAESILVLSASIPSSIEAFLESLTTQIQMIFGQGRETPSLTRARHRTALEQTLMHLESAMVESRPELMAENLRRAARCLGQITGRVDVEDLLDVIFRDFCIGK